jgi:hypothetical protein
MEAVSRLYGAKDPRAQVRSSRPLRSTTATAIAEETGWRAGGATHAPAAADSMFIHGPVVDSMCSPRWAGEALAEAPARERGACFICCLYSVDVM